MAGRVKKLGESPPKKNRPGISPEADENRMIALAVRAAEKQLEEGTASAAVIVHYLKLASSKERLEQEKAQRELELLEAKTEALKSQRRVEELYSEALRAMKSYAYDSGGASNE